MRFDQLCNRFGVWLFGLLPVAVLADAYYIPGATWNAAGTMCEMSGVYGRTAAEAVALHFPAHNEATGLDCLSNPCCCPATPAGFDETAFYELSACGGTVPYRYRIYRLLDPKNPPACAADGASGRGGGVSSTAGNPVNVATGNKHQAEVDLSMPEIGLSFVRYYNSNAAYSDDYGTSQDVGELWRTGYSAALLVLADGSADPNSTLPAPVIKARRPDGRLVTFTRTSGQWVSEADIHMSLAETASGYAITAPNGVTEEYEPYANGKARLARIVRPNGMAQTLAYNAAGQLESVTGPFGHTLRFTYTGGRLATLTGPGGQTHTYAYDANANLEYVYYPDGSTDTWLNNPYRRYHYEKPGHTFALTGISDSLNGQEVRYATFNYDARGRATLSHHAGNAERVDIAYNDADGTRTVRNSRDIPSTYTTVSQLGVELVTGIAGPGCSTCGKGEESSYYDPATNNLMYRRDGASVIKYGEYDTSGNYHCRVEGIGPGDTTDLALDSCAFDPAASPDARIIRYSYSQLFRGKTTRITGPSVYPGAARVTTHAYDSFGNRTLERIQGFRPDGMPVVRETRWTYGGPNPGDCPESEAPFHQLCRIDGPRTDVSDITTLRYWPFDPGAASHGPDDGRLKEIEDANGKLVRHDIHYTDTGKVWYEYDANGVMTAYEYYPGSDRLKRVEVAATAGTQYTEWTYLDTGEVTTITMGDGVAAA
ncbi:MAG: DUF6531 domain-containing protein, partial [Gammaproteobacteria bacterium]